MVEDDTFYTSYFGNLRHLPTDVIPISIALKTPAWFTGHRYPKLAPTPDILVEYQANGEEHLYMRRYLDEILGKLDQNAVYSELCALAGTKSFALICYERPEKFCHRHIVAEWFRKAGYSVQEWHEYCLLKG